MRDQTGTIVGAVEPELRFVPKEEQGDTGPTAQSLQLPRMASFGAAKAEPVFNMHLRLIAP